MTVEVISAQSSEDLQEAAELLRAGKLVVIPTETVYGLGANALDAVAAARIFEAKQRPHFDPLIVHVANDDGLQRVAAEVSQTAQRLIDAFWPGPLTLIMRKTEVVPSIVTSGMETVAVRMPAHLVAQRLIALAGVPIAAPSANSFGHLSPTRAQHVVEDLGDAVDLIVDGGACEFGVESTIIDVSMETPTVLRYGAISVEDIERVIGPVAARTESTSNPKAPGQLTSHYAPRTPLRIVELSQMNASMHAAYLTFSQIPTGEWRAGEVLSSQADLRVAASRLFEALHALDNANVSEIQAELVSDEGIGKAINDRLRRASTPME